MGKRGPQIILKTDERTVVLDWARWEICRKINGLGQKPLFLEGDRLEVAVKSGRWVLTHLPADPAAPKPVRHYFPDD